MRTTWNALGFYRDVIGLGVTFTSPQWTELAWHDVTIAPTAAGRTGKAESWLGLHVDDLESAVAAIRTGRRSKEGPNATREGARLVAVTDTEGNSLTIGQQPALR